MEVRLVGEEVPGRDGTERIVALELSNDQLDACAIIVETPKVQRLQLQIGDEHLIMIAPDLEQGELGGRLFGLRSPDHHEAKGVRPAMRLVAKLGRLDTAADGGVAQCREPSLMGRVRRGTITKWACCDSSHWTSAPS